MGVALRLSELHLVHTFTDIPMYVCATLIHGRELKMRLPSVNPERVCR